MFFEKFEGAYLDPEEKNIRSEINKIQNSLNHRVLHEQDPAYQEFRQKLMMKIEDFEKRNPKISFESEKSQLLI